MSWNRASDTVDRNKSYDELLVELQQVIDDATELRADGEYDKAEAKLTYGKNVVMAARRRNGIDKKRAHLRFGPISIGTVFKSGDDKFALVKEYEADDERLFARVVETVEHIALYDVNDLVCADDMAEDAAPIPALKRAISHRA